MTIENRLRKLEEAVGIELKESEDSFVLYFYDYMKNKFVLSVSPERISFYSAKTRVGKNLISLIGGNNYEKFLKYNGTSQKTKAIRTIIQDCYDSSNSVVQFKRKLEIKLNIPFYLT